MRLKKLALLVLAMSANANATLIDRGNGLIYDSNNNVTWTADANLRATLGLPHAASSGSGNITAGSVYWSVANTWAANLVFGGIDNWRLASVTEFNSLFSDIGGVDGTSIVATHNSTYDLFFNIIPNGVPASGYGSWTNSYWATGSGGAVCGFSFGGSWTSTPGVGWCDPSDTVNAIYAWAVSPGDIAPPPVVIPPVSGGPATTVPEPVGLALLGVGLIGLGLQRRARDAALID